MLNIRLGDLPVLAIEWIDSHREVLDILVSKDYKTTIPVLVSVSEFIIILVCTILVHNIGNSLHNGTLKHTNNTEVQTWEL